MHYIIPAILGALSILYIVGNDHSDTKTAALAHTPTSRSARLKLTVLQWLPTIIICASITGWTSFLGSNISKIRHDTNIMSHTNNEATWVTLNHIVEATRLANYQMISFSILAVGLIAIALGIKHYTRNLKNTSESANPRIAPSMIAFGTIMESLFLVTSEIGHRGELFQVHVLSHHLTVPSPAAHQAAVATLKTWVDANLG